MQQAMEERNPRAFLAYVSEDFIGNSADFDRAALANLLRIEVFRNDQVRRDARPDRYRPAG